MTDVPLQFQPGVSVKKLRAGDGIEVENQGKAVEVSTTRGLQILGPYNIGYNDDPSPLDDYIDYGPLPAGLLIVHSWVVVTEDWGTENEDSMKPQVNFGPDTDHLYAAWLPLDLTPGEGNVLSLSDNPNVHFEDWGPSAGFWRQAVHLLSADNHLFMNINGFGEPPNPVGTGRADIFLLAFDAGVLT